MIDSNDALDTHKSSTATVGFIAGGANTKESTDRPWMNRSSSTLEPSCVPHLRGCCGEINANPAQPCPARDQDLPGSPPSYFLFGKGPGESLAREAKPRLHVQC